jgi:hypothetical protein
VTASSVVTVSSVACRWRPGAPCVSSRSSWSDRRLRLRGTARAFNRFSMDSRAGARAARLRPLLRVRPCCPLRLAHREVFAGAFGLPWATPPSGATLHPAPPTCAHRSFEPHDRGTGHAQHPVTRSMLHNTVHVTLCQIVPTSAIAKYRMHVSFRRCALAYIGTHCPACLIVRR